jgi:hypothetical protein
MILLNPETFQVWQRTRHTNGWEKSLPGMSASVPLQINLRKEPTITNLTASTGYQVSKIIVKTSWDIRVKIIKWAGIPFYQYDLQFKYCFCLNHTETKNFDQHFQSRVSSVHELAGWDFILSFKVNCLPWPLTV